MTADAERPGGCSLDVLAGAAGLERADLERLGVTEANHLPAPAVRFRYLDEEGVELAARYQTSVPGSPHGAQFVWRGDSSPFPFGLWRLRDAHDASRLLLVTDELDALVLWDYGIPALGLPDGALDPGWIDHFDGIADIALLGTSPAALAATEAALAGSETVAAVRVVELDRDIALIHAEDPPGFEAALERLLEGGVSLANRELARAAERREQARAACEELLLGADILTELEHDLEARGAAGVGRQAKVLFLCLTTRVLQRPVSPVIKGPSAAGKSFLVDSVLEFFPDSAYYVLTGMSERALIYSPVDLRHVFLVITEAAGIGGDIARYIIRSILSEGRLRWETTVWGEHGGETQVIEKDGPTGLMVTTTAVALDDEQETRMLSITVADTQEQTRAILCALAADDRSPVDFTRWHALQNYVTTGPREVTIPYGVVLANSVPPVAVRLRRDFRALMDLVRAHALLYQEYRERDDAGRVVAALADYDAVRDLVAELLAEGVEQTVSPTVRQTVEAVERLVRESSQDDAVTVTDVAEALNIDRSAALRRVNAALRAGYLDDIQGGGRGRKKLLKPGEPLPEDQELFPPMETLAVLWEEAKHRGEAGG